MPGIFQDWHGSTLGNDMKPNWTDNILGPFLGTLLGCAIFMVPTMFGLGLYHLLAIFIENKGMAAMATFAVIIVGFASFPKLSSVILRKIFSSGR